MEPNIYDHLGFASDKIIQSIIGDEIIYYSNKVHKYNKLSMKQERCLLLTNICLYNLQNKKLKRSLKYIEIIGITYSVQSNEFVIHAKDGFDFHFICEEKLIIIYIIAKCYEKIKNEPIIICEVNDKSLKQFVISKKNKKKDINNTKLNKKYAIDTRTFIEDNPPPKMNKRRFTEYNINNLNFIQDQEEPPKIFNDEAIFSLDNNTKFINLEDFSIKGIIGRGITNKVMLALCLKNKKYYTIKYLSKINLETDNNEALNSYLQNKLAKLYYHFLNNVEFCFQTQEKIYFVFPYIEGELLYNHIKQHKNIEENKVKFYGVIIALSIKYLHTIKMTNINISSRNIFINKDGYLKLIPFHKINILPLKKDYSEKISQKYKNEYTPPEIFLNLDIDKKICDWWNLGILIFEMIYGITPFYSEIDTELKNIICNNELKFPNKPLISESCKDLITKLLNKNYEERLGYNNDFDDIRNHEFFKDINFNELSEKKIESFYKPEIIDVNEGIKKKKLKFNYDDLIKNGIDFET